MKQENKKRNKLIVITYHKILNSSSFEKQIQYLSENYKIGLNLNYGFEGKKQVVITVDDGDVSFYNNAFPVLKKYNLPAILFVVSNLINSQKPFWWDEIEYYLGKEEGNKKVWEVKTLANFEREDFLKNLRKNSIKSPLKYKQLTTSQLKEMQQAGIMIANHSHTHPMFDKCTQEELEKEMEKSTNTLEVLGFTPDVFAYPNGNYSQTTELVLKKFGIKKTFLFDHKINNSVPNPLRISRLIVNDTTPMWKFKLILSGWHSKLLPVTKGLSKLKKKL